MNPIAARRLRDGWAFVELREVGRIVTGSTPPKAKTEYYGGSFPFVKPPELRHGPVNDAEDKLSDKGAEIADVAPIGSVLVSCIGNLGKTGRATRPVAFNQQINAIIPHEPNASKWIFYAVQTSDFASQLVNVASATTITIVNKGKFSGLRIPLAPEDEQREIVAEIEKQFTRLEAGVAGLRRVQANLKRYRAAVLKAACEGKLVPTEAELARQEGRTYETGAQLLERILDERRQKWSGKGKYKEPAKPETPNLPPLPGGWTWTTMGAAIISGPQNGIYLPKASYGRGCPILRIDDFQEGWVRDRDELNTVAADPETLRVYQLNVGDLIINRVNSPSHLGKCLVVRDSLVPAVFESNMMRVVLSSSIRARYVEFYLRSRDGRSRLNCNAKWAVNQASINQQDVKSITLPLPPLPEQQRIVAEVERRLSVVEELEAVVSANLQRATRLRQSILQRAFEGQLVQITTTETSNVLQHLPMTADAPFTYGVPE